MDLLDLQPVIDRVRISAGPALKSVVSAADLYAMKKAGGVIASDTVGILFSGAQPGPPEEGSGPLRQTIDATISAIIAVMFAGALGTNGLKAIAAPCRAVRRALFGWEHPGGQHPDAQVVRKFWLGPEDVEDFDEKAGLLFYRMDFSTRLRIQEP